jgi:hypothetical protein
MRKLKAIYLIPVFLVLAIGLAAGGYYMMIVPQMAKTKTAQDEWKKAKEACPTTKEDDWKVALEAKRKDAEKLWNDQQTFAAIQNQMPDIKNMAVVYAGKETDGIRAWYTMWSTPKMANELRRWGRKFGTGKVPDIKFDGPLILPDESLPDVKIVEMDLGTQTLWARGYPDLISQLARRTGYGFCPMIVEPDGGAIKVTVHRNHPRHTVQKPVLSMTIKAKAYFMTRGWDPNGDAAAVAQLLEQAREAYSNPGSTTPKRRLSFGDPLNENDAAYSGSGYTPTELQELHGLWESKKWGPCPKVLGIIEAKDVTP